MFYSFSFPKLLCHHSLFYQQSVSYDLGQNILPCITYNKDSVVTFFWKRLLKNIIALFITFLLPPCNAKLIDYFNSYRSSSSIFLISSRNRILVNFEAKRPKDQILKKLYRPPIVAWIFDRFFLPRCHKKRNE